MVSLRRVTFALVVAGVVCGVSTESAAQSATGPRVARSPFTSGAEAIQPGAMGPIAIMVENPTSAPLAGLEAEITTSGGAKLVVQGRLVASRVDRHRIPLPVIQPNESVPIGVLVAAPANRLPDGAIPIRVALYAAGRLVMPAQDLGVFNPGYGPSAAVTSNLRLGPVFTGSAVGRAIMPGQVGAVSVYIVNQSDTTVSRLEAEFTTAGGVKVVVPMPFKKLETRRELVNTIPPHDSMMVTVAIEAPKSSASIDSPLPMWVALYAGNQLVMPAVDLELFNSGSRRSAATVMAAVPASISSAAPSSTPSPTPDLTSAIRSSLASAAPPRVTSTPSTVPPAAPVSTPPTVMSRAAMPSESSSQRPAATPAVPFMSDIDVRIPTAKTPRPDDIAVVIGNRNYRRAPEVSYAINDARSMRTYLQQALGFRPGNIIFVEDATLSDMKVLFGDVGNPTGRLSDFVKPGRSDVWVYYSGHGAPDASAKRAYLMPVDADANRLALTGLSVDMLYDNLSKIGARHVTVVLDACFSGASGSGQMLITAASPIGIQVNDPSAAFAGGGGATIIAAAEGQQLANWHTDQQHGMLTYFLLKGLQGSADANADGAITVTEMQRWLTDRTDGVPYEARRQHGRDQTPMVWGAGDRVIRR